MKNNSMSREISKKCSVLTVEQEKSILVHVLEFYVDDMEKATQSEIRESIRCIKNDVQYGIVSGGCLLIKNWEINDYIKSLNISFTDTIEAYECYKYLVDMVIEYYIDDIIVVIVDTGTIWTYNKFFIGGTMEDILDFFPNNNNKIHSYYRI